MRGRTALVHGRRARVLWAYPAGAYMSVEKHGRGWRARWRDDAGRVRRSRVFDAKRDAQLFDAEVRRRKALGSLASLDADKITLDEFLVSTWAVTWAPHLAERTRRHYAWLYDKHVGPYLGDLTLRDLSPETIGRWQAGLLADGAGRARS